MIKYAHLSYLMKPEAPFSASSLCLLKMISFFPAWFFLLEQQILFIMSPLGCIKIIEELFQIEKWLNIIHYMIGVLIFHNQKNTYSYHNNYSRLNFLTWMTYIISYVTNGMYKNYSSDIVKRLNIVHYMIGFLTFCIPKNTVACCNSCFR